MSDTEVTTKQRSLDWYKTLVLNADYQPLTRIPLSVRPWEDAVKLLYEGVVNLVEVHPGIVVRSPTVEMPIPSVVALKEYVKPPTRVPFTKYNVFLRDMFTCQYCGDDYRGQTSKLTFEHVVPRSKGGLTKWFNIATACQKCNSLKEDKSCAEAKMWPKVQPYEPTIFELTKKAQQFPPGHLHDTWRDYLYWDTELDP